MSQPIDRTWDVYAVRPNGSGVPLGSVVAPDLFKATALAERKWANELAAPRTRARLVYRT